MTRAEAAGAVGSISRVNAADLLCFRARLQDETAVS
jgi:hypothetical protein